ncbi:hypothetical protein M3Y97_00994000 [Aphelenchoides bicaudatus]|nr:hypothetical protein M3Y97_00994000 [Aphelenchoides bicaudatus]
MTDKCETHIMQKFFDFDGEGDEDTFDLYYYANEKFYDFDAEDPPYVLYLFDGPYDPKVLTDVSNPWVQFAKNNKSMIYGVELRGKGKSLIKGKDSSKDSKYFTTKHHADDLMFIYDSAIKSYGLGPWLLVGKDAAATLAIWNRISEKSVFKCAYAIDPELSKLDSLDNKSFLDYQPSNLILVGSNKEKFDALSTFAGNFDPTKSNIFAVEESDNKEILKKLNDVVLK